MLFDCLDRRRQEAFATGSTSAYPRKLKRNCPWPKSAPDKNDLQRRQMSPLITPTDLKPKATRDIAAA